MSRHPNRRDVLKTTAKLAAAGCLTADQAMAAPIKPPMPRAAKPLPHPAKPVPHVAKPLPEMKRIPEIDSVLHTATSDGHLPGIVAMAATDSGILYEGAFGLRRAHDGPAMTRDTVFRIASMVKVITTVAALRLVEQGRLSLDAPVPDIDPALGSPQVFDGFDSDGHLELRPAKRPILLRHLLTHTSGFTYRLWDEKALSYSKAVGQLPVAAKRKAPHEPLMFDPGDRWQYGTSIDWVGHIIEAVSHEPFEMHVRKHILDPLKMHDTVFMLSPPQQKREASAHRRLPDGSWKPDTMEKQFPQRFFGGGGIYSTGPDYLTFIRMLMAGGAIDGVRILRPETVALMGQNQIGAVDVGVLRTTAPSASNDVDFFPDINLKWGFGHLINMEAVPDGRSAGSLTWGGLLNTYYWIDPQKRIAAVFLTQVLPFADDRALRIYREFERGVYRAAAAG
jgi:methyl acetate hydrolase